MAQLVVAEEEQHGIAYLLGFRSSADGNMCVLREKAGESRGGIG